MSTYPGIYYTHEKDLVDNVDVVHAEHVNELRAEVLAVERTLGLNPHVGTMYNTGNFDNVKDRLDSLENRALSSTDYVTMAGASVIRRERSGGGLAIRSIQGEDSFAPLEILKPGILNWDGGGTKSLRSAIRLWGSGEIEAGTYTGRKAGVSGTATVQLVPDVTVLATGLLGTTEVLNITNTGQTTLGEFHTVTLNPDTGQARIAALIRNEDSSDTRGVRITSELNAVGKPFEVVKGTTSVLNIDADGIVQSGGTTVHPVSGLTVVGNDGTGLSTSNLDFNSLDFSTTAALTAGGTLSVDSPETKFTEKVTFNKYRPYVWYGHAAGHIDGVEANLPNATSNNLYGDTTYYGKIDPVLSNQTNSFTFTTPADGQMLVTLSGVLVVPAGAEASVSYWIQDTTDDSTEFVPRYFRGPYLVNNSSGSITQSMSSPMILGFTGNHNYKVTIMGYQARGTCQAMNLRLTLQPLFDPAKAG